MLKQSFFIFTVIFFAAWAHAGTWSLRQQNDQPVVETTGTAKIGDLHVKAFLSFSCNTTGKPVAWLDYTISDADNVTKVFDLTPFEGPYAPAQSKALVLIELTGGGPAEPLRAHQSGWRSSEHPGGFGFGIGGRPHESQALSRLFKQMAREGALLSIRISSFGKPQCTILSEFPLDGSREALSALAAFCR